MSKILILDDDSVQQEIELEERQLVIGRDASNGIHLDDPSVSRRHAMLTCALGEYFIEDLGSTNGTFLNDRPITKHMLNHGDLLQVGDLVLKYQKVVEQEEVVDDDPEKTQVISRQRPHKSPDAGVVVPKTATIRYFRGPKKGQSEQISRSLYTLGRPGGDVAVIARRPQGFFLLKIGHNSSPMINNKKVDVGGGIKLNEGDVVEVGENIVEISFTG
ncbi:MAG: FHA domain-containing protein [Gammaproteobacteria bacterium]|nr:FHA domain-containing protein [Gammaproteobacteria bacterium]